MQSGWQKSELEGCEPLSPTNSNTHTQIYIYIYGQYDKRMGK
jgi:hypothetical protein